MKRVSVRTALIVSTALIAILLATTITLAWKYHQAISGPQAQSQASARIVSKIGKLYILPTDEEPTVIQIQDKNQLQDKTFFNNAQNGDYVLIYPKNKLAIVYRENINKLVKVGPVNISDTQAGTKQ